MMNQNGSADMPLTEAVRLALLEQAEAISQELHRACSDDRAEAVEGAHDARVALRRSIALLELAAFWIDEKWASRRIKVWRRFLKMLGRVRDADVLAIHAEHFFAEHSETDAEPLLAILHDRQKERRKKLCKRLNSKESLQALGREMAALTVADATMQMLPVPVSNRGDVRLYRVADCLPVMLWQAAAAITVFHSVVSGAESTTSDEPVLAVSESVLHRLRLAAKDFRYLITFARPWLGDAAERIIKDFRQFQDVLGNWHDAVMARRLLEKMKQDQQTENAACLWLAERQTEADSLERQFMELWRCMTPDWFHEHLTDCLKTFFQSDENKDCNGCGKS